MKTLRILAGLTGLAGVLLSFTHGPTSAIPDLAERLTRFFSFFTILTNLGFAFSLLLPALAGRGGFARALSRLVPLFTFTAAILLVGVTYHLLLLWDLRSRTGLSYAASVICHYIMPSLALVIWTLDPPRVRLRWRSCLAALLYPLLYLALILWLGTAKGWYPYPFLDLSKLGTAGFLKNTLLLAFGFAAAAAALILIQRLRLGPPRKRPRR